MDEATDAVCCHSMEMRVNKEARVDMARHVWETEREGNGLTSRSEPPSSISSCQPGKVERRIVTILARKMAAMLEEWNG